MCCFEPTCKDTDSKYYSQIKKQKKTLCGRNYFWNAHYNRTMSNNVCSWMKFNVWNFNSLHQQWQPSPSCVCIRREYGADELFRKALLRNLWRSISARCSNRSQCRISIQICFLKIWFITNIIILIASQAFRQSDWGKTMIMTASVNQMECELSV